MRAAFRLDDQVARLMPGQPWGDTRGMGNRPRHGDGRITLSVIRCAVQNELPPLLAGPLRSIRQSHATGHDSPGCFARDR